MPKFTFVYVPADPSREIEEQELEIPEGRDVECFLEHVKRQLAASSTGMEAAHAAAQQQAFLQRLPKGQTVPDDLLKAASGMHLVENICLLSNSKKNNFVGVNMYVDDTGTLKNLPVNPRATEICHCCGKLLEVHGDAWIARIFDNEDEFKRLDFSRSELSSSAPWVQTAREQTQNALRSEAAETTIKRLQADAHSRARPIVKELSAAESAKEDGNAAFKKGAYEEAVASYSRCLTLDSTMVSARNNRAMALLKLSRWQEALEDCDMVLAADNENVKALLRKGQAHQHLNDLDAARAAYAKALQIQPNNVDASAALANLGA